MQMYVEDLHNCDAYLQDRNMAQSVAMAIPADGELIAQAFREEQQAARDREMSMRLVARGDQGNAGPASRAAKRSKKMHKNSHKDPWEDTEMLEKVAAIYMKAPDQTTPDAQAVDDDSEETVAESSAFAARRETKTKRPLKSCIICGDEKNFFEVLRVPCNHEYCRTCLESLFSRSMIDESLFPPKCDQQEIPLDWVRLFISGDLAKEFEAKYDELSIKNRTYCHEPTCSTFILDETFRGHLATCPRCQKTTCTECKNPSHAGDCPDDDALRQLIETADTEQWQRCHRCTAIVQLEQGCNHMRCRCGAEFCYICGEQWKTCRCELWDEGRLTQRAEQLIDRNPNRRLFQPPRVDHAQPVTRPPTRPPTPELPPILPVVGISGPSTVELRRASIRDIVSPTSFFEADFSDHSEWEPDWWLNDVALPTLTGPTIIDPETHIGSETPNGPGTPIDRDALPPGPAVQVTMPPAPNVTDEVSAARNERIAEAMDYLRANHACEHSKWRYRKGWHKCEECRHVLKEFIFECRHCSLQACNRCRRNRL